MKTLDKILIIVGVSIAVFTVTMIVTFYVCGSIPRHSLHLLLFGFRRGVRGHGAYTDNQGKVRQKEKGR